MNVNELSKVIAVLLTGLLAGLFYSYACSVTRGLGKLSDAKYLKAFQVINRAILNLWFFASFIGCFFVLPVTSWISCKAGANISFYLLLSAIVIYFIGVSGVTMIGNEPLNKMLGNFNINAASTQEVFSLRERFEMP